MKRSFLLETGASYVHNGYTRLWLYPSLRVEVPDESDEKTLLRKATKAMAKEICCRLSCFNEYDINRISQVTLKEVTFIRKNEVKKPKPVYEYDSLIEDKVIQVLDNHKTRRKER